MTSSTPLLVLMMFCNNSKNFSRAHLLHTSHWRYSRSDPHALPRLSLISFSTAQQTLLFHFEHYGPFFGWRRPATCQSA